MSEILIPNRRRRRPALSCVECRRRKIKCDRRLPCTHCVQVKFPACVYPETHSIVNPRTNSKPSSTTRSANVNIKSTTVSPSASGVSSTQSSAYDLVTRTFPSLGSESYCGSWSLVSTPATSSNDTHHENNAQTHADRGSPLGPMPPASMSNNKHNDEVMSVLGVNMSSFGDAILQVGGNHSAPTTQLPTKGSSIAIERKECNPERTQFFGRSHWMNTFNTFTRRCRFKDGNGNLVTGIESHEVREILEDCRRVIKAAKAKRVQANSEIHFKDQVPSREIADELVNLYFRTHESTYRILHIPSFMKEYTNYWDNPVSTNTTLVVRMLLVMAIGTSFYQGPREDELRNQAKQWVQLAQSWATIPVDGRQLTIPWIQIYCLLLLTQQINTLRIHLVWISSGNLLRTAFSMGLHLDPKHFPKLSFVLAEIRRRIWATVLEMVVQTSMDVGMPPLITSNDFDTEPPSNFDDWDISADMTTMPIPKPNDVYTRTSLQIILAKSLRTRLEIMQLINGFHSETSYEEVLRLGQVITKACNEASKLIHSYPIALPRPTALQSNLVDILVRRFLLEVHRPFFLRAQTDPRYYFSRKVCLETALVIFSHSGSKDLQPGHDPQLVNDYELLKMVGEGLVKSIFFHAITIVVVELILQLEEDIASSLPPSAQARTSRAPLYRAIQDMIKLTTDRVRMGENNAVGPVFLSAAAALINALTNGIPPEEVVPEAAKRSAQECFEILRARLKNVPQDGVQGQYAGHEIEGSENTGAFGFDFSMADSDMDFGMGENLDLGIQDSWLLTDWDAC